jgi:hypothetical protein
MIGKPGCFQAGTSVLMYNGTFKNVEDIIVGDQVMGDDSTPRNVLELCHNMDEMYRIVLYDGESVTVNKQHILCLKNTNTKNTFINVTVEDFLTNCSDHDTYKWCKTNVDFPETILEFEPFVVGYWISFQHTHTVNEEYVVQWYENFYASININMTRRCSALFFKFLHTRDLLLSKYIPPEYKVNKRLNRLRLLAGIIKGCDTDNPCLQHHGCIGLSHPYKDFIKDVIFIARSVGLNVYKYHTTPMHLPEDICRLSSKHYQYTCCIPSADLMMVYKILYIPNVHNHTTDLPTDNTTLPTNQHEFKISYSHHGEYYGFILDGNHRFLLSDCSVVHNTGKSSIIASLLYYKKHLYPAIQVFSGTENHTGFFKTYIPDIFIYDELDEECINNFVKRQLVAKKYLSNPNAVLVIDDCTDDPKVLNKPLFQKLYKNGRHFNMLFILSLQYALDIKPNIRNNIDGVFILREPNVNTRKKLWENYSSIIPTFALFCKIMDRITTDYTALYINNQTTSNNFQDCIFYYNAPTDIPKCIWFGTKYTVDFNNKRINPDYVPPIL